MDDAGRQDASAVAAAAATANAGHLSPPRPSEHLTPRVTRGIIFEIMQDRDVVTIDRRYIYAIFGLPNRAISDDLE